MSTEKKLRKIFGKDYNELIGALDSKEKFTEFITAWLLDNKKPKIRTVHVDVKKLRRMWKKTGKVKITDIKQDK